MSIPFRSITLADKALVSSFTLRSEYRNCDFSFSNMCSWRFLYDTEWAVVAGFLMIRFHIDGWQRPVYMMPVGEGELATALSLLEQDSLSAGHPLLLLGITPDARIKLEQALPGQFHYLKERDFYDYIYLREDLATLRGKRYQAKRNHINGFKKLYSYQYLPITAELVPECLQLEAIWYQENRTEEESEELNQERQSIAFALSHFEELGLTGGAICHQNRIIAFSFGSPINHDTFGVHIEKADVSYNGIYALINQEFALHLPEQYTYINREEDLGLPGLRQAKLSYHPIELLEKCTTVKKSNL